MIVKLVGLFVTLDNFVTLLSKSSKNTSVDPESIFDNSRGIFQLSLSIKSFEYTENFSAEISIVFE